MGTRVRRFEHVLLDVWQEVGRHIELGESIERIADLLESFLPLGMIVFRRFDIKRSSVETLAASAVGGLAMPRRTRDELPPAVLEKILVWSRQGRVLRCSVDAVRERFPGLAPEDVGGHLLAGPINLDEGPAGIVLLLGVGKKSFSPRHEGMLSELLEPLSVAFQNDQRVRELSSLREAAIAENESLLGRLGREDGGEPIVGAHSGLRHVMERVDLVAGSHVPVLILGETGSGKEVVARAIHGGSPRGAGPFLRVNCGAIPPELIDSELFGHEKGSFTGAIGQKRGWFERADGGTLFLDEIGELPLAAQVRLLRILEDGSFERVGGEKLLTVDVRIVAATHRDLHAMVADGRFREDLWFRLAVFPIRLPSLRERPEDVADLAAHFALRAAKRFGLPPLAPTADDVDLLVAYPWPGNVRELRTVVERAAILGNGKRLEVAKALGIGLPAGRDHAVPAPAPPLPLSGSKEEAVRPGADPAEPFLSLEAAMARHIEKALERTGGRIEGRRGAARLLKINPHTLRGRMRKLGVDWKKFRADDLD